MPIVTVAVFVFVLYCVLDVALSDAEEMRTFPKPVWLVLVILLPVIGGIAWLTVGRPAGGRRPGTGPTLPRPAPPRGGSGGRPGPGTTPPRRPTGGGGNRGRPKGPDDDPEFLRRLNEDLQRRDDDDRPGGS